MRLKKFVSFVLLSVIFLFYISIPSAQAIDYPEIAAKSAILLDADTGTKYFSFYENEERDPASLVKIMTALLAFEAIERGDAALTDMVTVSETAIRGISDYGGADCICIGEELSLESLLYCTLVASMNEASNVIAEHISGSVDAFVSAMNERAAELGCNHTHFKNTHGQTASGQYSSAYDIALICAEAIKYPMFDEIVNTLSKEIPATNLSDVRYISTTNKLISPDASRFYYTEACGIKTGSTMDAGFCLASSIQRDDMSIISVVLGCEQIEVEGGYFDTQSFVQTKILQEWLLDNFSSTSIVSVKDLVCEIPIKLGEGMDRVVVRPDRDISVLLPNDFDKSTITSEIALYGVQDEAEALVAPVKAGTVVGEMTVCCDGRNYGPINLVTNNDVSRSKLAYVKYEAVEILNNRWVKLGFIAFAVIIVLYIIFVIRYNIVRAKRREAAKANRGTANSMPREKNKRDK